MAWSTRQIAELAGTSLRSVRHYHEVGLLPEPQRRANGYKSYGVAHLVRLLRIRRLTDLGFSLAQIAELGDADEHPGEALRALDDELAGTIDRLQRARVELALIMRREVPADLPAELAPVAAADISEEERALTVVMSRALGPSGMQSVTERIRRTRREPAFVEFDELGEDADEPTRRALVRALLPLFRTIRDEQPELRDVYADAPRGERFAMETVQAALLDVYNSAQIDVMVRVSGGLDESPAADQA